MEKLTAAVIGCGRMGAFTSDSVRRYSPSCWLPLSHIEAIQACDNLSLTAICDVNPELLQKAQQHYAINRGFNDYQQLLTEMRPDILCIATRTPERASIITAGIRHGVKGFHIEKPLCNSVEQLNTLENLVNSHHIILTYGTVRRYFDVYRTAREIIDSGELGTLQQVDINFGHAPLFWTHPHSIDLLLFFNHDQQPDYVQGRLDNVVMGSRSSTIESDPGVQSATLYFPNGVVGQVNRTQGSDVVLSCTGGKLIIEADGRGITTFRSTGNSPYYPSSPQSMVTKKELLEGTYAALQQLVYRMETGKTEIEQANKPIFLGQKVLFALVQSHLANSQLIALNCLDSQLVINGKTNQLPA